MTGPKTPAQRTAEARDRLCVQLIGYSDESAEAMDAYARAYYDEAVAPALAYLTEVARIGSASPEVIETLRNLLTDRSGT